jgi:hypothetical protein
MHYIDDVGRGIGFARRPEHHPERAKDDHRAHANLHPLSFFIPARLDDTRHRKVA